MFKRVREQDFPGGSDGKESACNDGDLGLILGSERFCGEGNGLPTSIFLPDESHRQRNLAGYSPWDLPGKNTGVGCHCFLHGKHQETRNSINCQNGWLMSE